MTGVQGKTDEARSLSMFLYRLICATRMHSNPFPVDRFIFNNSCHALKMMATHSVFDSGFKNQQPGDVEA